MPGETHSEHRLYLMRHAKSSWDDPELDDRQRPLSKRGKEATKSLRRYLRREGIRPDLIICSPALRTRQTLEGIQEAFTSKIKKRIEPALYSSPQEILRILNELPEKVGSVMLIGHNPWTQELAESLANSGPLLGKLRESFPTAALATLSFRGGWVSLGPGSAALVAYVIPAELP